MNKYITKLIVVLLILISNKILIAQIAPQCTYTNPLELITPVVTLSDPDLTPVINPAFTPPITPTDTTSERLIEWVHGLGGDEYAWRPALHNTSDGSADGDFKARKAKGYTMTYTEGNISMRDCALNVYHDIENHSATYSQTAAQRKRNMVIAHSQGSIVTRTICMEKDNQPTEQPFGGIAFFVGPHNGGQLMVSARAGEGAKFSAWACNLLLAPKIKETLYNLPGTVKFFLNLNTTSNSLTTTICDTLIGKTVATYFVDKIAGQFQTNALLPNSPHLKSLRDYETGPTRQWKTHRVNFTSAEDDEGYLIWRTINFFLNPSIRAENFGANDDKGPGTLKWDMDSVQLVYENKAIEYEGLYHAYDIGHPKPNALFGDIGNIIAWLLVHKPTLKDLKTTWDAYENSQEFFDNANNRWKVLIGTRKPKVHSAEITLHYEYHGTVYTYTEPMNCFSEDVCTTWAEDWHFHVNPTNVPDEANYRFYTLKLTYDYTQAVETPSDGIVPVASQAGLPDATLPQQKLIGSSHMQIRNDKNMKTSLRGLFDGTLSNAQGIQYKDSREWFMTPTK